MTIPDSFGTRAADPNRGLFISFEGTEGSGKSTQMRFLVKRLRNLGFRVTENQEPGATVIGKEIRRVLLNPAHSEMTPIAELLLMFASRAQAAAEVIVPALNRGEIVASDRFTDSSLAYQGEARGLGFETVWQLHKLALGGLLPDLTLCIQVDLETALARAHRRNQAAGSETDETRLDRQSVAFHKRVSEGYATIARAEPKRFRLIDGSGDSEQVAGRVWAAVNPLLPAQP